MKFILLLFALSLFTLCKEIVTDQEKITAEKSEKEVDAQQIDLIQNDCPKRSFNQALPNQFSIETIYYQCEPDWKVNLQILKESKVIFKADTLLEYEFIEHDYPTYIIDGSLTYILILRNDRPLKNVIDVFQIRDDHVDSVFTIPHLDNSSDYDNDGIIEFWSTKNHIELNANGKMTYQPLIAYEITESSIRLDSVCTSSLNENAYGSYYGIDVIDTLEFDYQTVQSQWPKVE